MLPYIILGINSRYHELLKLSHHCFKEQRGVGFQRGSLHSVRWCTCCASISYVRGEQRRYAVCLSQCASLACVTLICAVFLFTSPRDPVESAGFMLAGPPPPHSVSHSLLLVLYHPGICSTVVRVVLCQCSFFPVHIISYGVTFFVCFRLGSALLLTAIMNDDAVRAGGRWGLSCFQIPPGFKWYA